MNTEEITKRLHAQEVQMLAMQIALSALLRNAGPARRDLMLAAVSARDFFLAHPMPDEQIAAVEKSLLRLLEQSQASL